MRLISVLHMTFSYRLAFSMPDQSLLANQNCVCGNFQIYLKVQIFVLPSNPFIHFFFFFFFFF